MTCHQLGLFLGTTRNVGERLIRRITLPGDYILYDVCVLRYGTFVHMCVRTFSLPFHVLLFDPVVTGVESSTSPIGMEID